MTGGAELVQEWCAHQWCAPEGEWGCGGACPIYRTHHHSHHGTEPEHATRKPRVLPLVTNLPAAAHWCAAETLRLSAKRALAVS